MANFTKQAIMAAFLELLGERPFDRITVTDVARRCGVSRNTFYYHYQDIFALVDEMFVTETDRFLQGDHDFSTWTEAVDHAMQFARDHRQAIYHLYNSSNRERLENYLYDVFHGLVCEFIDRQSADLDVAERDVADLAMFYAAAFEGVAMTWIRDGMPEDSKSLSNISRMIEGSIRTALENSIKNR